MTDLHPWNEAYDRYLWRIAPLDCLELGERVTAHYDWQGEAGR